jgi:ApeA N-terminal domain 1
VPICTLPPFGGIASDCNAHLLPSEVGVVAHTLEQVLGGSLGHYWLQNEDTKVDLTSDPIAGSLSQTEDGSVMLAGLISNPEAEFFNDSQTPNPRYAVGVTDNGGLLLSGISANRSSVSIGGSKASTTHYEIQSVAIDVAIDELDSGLALGASADWHGISRWAGVQTTSERPERDSEGRLRSLSIDLAQIDPIEVSLDEDWTLELGSTWRVTGARDSRVISAPLRVSVTSNEKRPLEGFIRKLVVMQDLLNLAFQGFVAASAGALVIDSSSTTNNRQLWNRRLMERAGGVRAPKSMTEAPLFYLASIGGVPGIKRWYELCETHPRLVRPILSPYHIGRAYAEAQLVEVGTAIDYWRGINKQSEQWAANQTFQPRAVADSIGDPFYSWIGDVDKWASQYWYHYNGLKHYIPNYKFDDESVYHLALSGLTLMTAVALQKTAGDGNEAARIALGGYRWAGRGESIRSWLGSI